MRIKYLWIFLGTRQCEYATTLTLWIRDICTQSFTNCRILTIKLFSKCRMSDPRSDQPGGSCRVHIDRCTTIPNLLQILGSVNLSQQWPLLGSPSWTVHPRNYIHKYFFCDARIPTVVLLFKQDCTFTACNHGHGHVSVVGIDLHANMYRHE
jgi:hypothetical protein